MLTAWGHGVRRNPAGECLEEGSPGGSAGILGVDRAGGRVVSRASERGIAGARKWFVLQTRSRQEKAVAEVVKGIGASQFLPLTRRIVHYGHRRRTVEAPLFSSYVFVWCVVEDAYRAAGTKRVVRIIHVSDQARISHELSQIRRAIDGDAELSPYRFLEAGRAVRVTSGPFRDLTGLVEEKLRQDRLVLQVHALGRALALEIDASLLELVD